MNDSIFACYDSLFYTGSLQDLQQSAIPHIAEQDLQVNALLFDGQVDVSMQELKQQQSVSEYSSLDTVSNAQRVISRDDKNAMVSSNAMYNNNPLNNIPFVQIHTTELLQPQRNNYGNVFRRTISNHAEIKSEPIKSEAAESSRISFNNNERTATPSSPQDEVVKAKDTTVEITEAAEVGFNFVQKCKQCRFLCLDAKNLEDHSKIHSSSNYNDGLGNNNTANNRMLCPGCCNVFFSYKSLEIHLIEDHFVSKVEAKQLIDRSKSTRIVEEAETPDRERKSRIYLKNVECLREPRRELSESDNIINNNISDGFSQINSFQDVETNEEEKQDPNQISISASYINREGSSITDSRPKQKISIKSVDVLREPALLRREYNSQNQLCNEINFDTINGFQPLSDSIICSASTSSINETANKDATFEKPRCPKIYIKNVDILKEPMIIPNVAANASMGMDECSPSLNYSFLSQSIQQPGPNSDFMNNPTSLGVSNQCFDSGNGGHFTIGDINVQDNFLYDNVAHNHYHVMSNSNVGNSLLTDVGGTDGFLQYPIVQCSGIDTSEHMGTNTLMSSSPVLAIQNTEDVFGNTIEQETQSTSASKQKQKIFIKNVDILKEPQFQEQRERRTLHLRTVDELNLMNRNEVENLIAPNLENNNMNSSGHHRFASHSENQKELQKEHALPDRDLFYQDDTSLKLQDYASQLVNNWSADDYDLGDEIECIVSDSIETINNVETTLSPLSSSSSSSSRIASAENLQKEIHDLETPQTSVVSLRDIEELTGPQPSGQTSSAANFASMLANANASNNTHGKLEPQDSPTINDHYDGMGSRATFDNSSTLSQNVENVYETKKAKISNTSIAKSELNAKIPPLAPVTCFVRNSKVLSQGNITTTTTTNTTTSNTNVTTKISTVTSSASQISEIPPLVPVSPQIFQSTLSSATKRALQESNTSVATNTITVPTATAAPAERGRIYVANNLMQPNPAKKNDLIISPQQSNCLSITGGTSVRGRPFGSNRNDNSNKMRSEKAAEVLKCSVRGCPFRFKKQDTLAYHKRCHKSDSSSLQAKICPECKSTDFGNWNTLHTHLWRIHHIDMELYSCPQCPFKTPIYSRLVNTHAKIHSEERNYKCELCGKAFKNTKQLKNHRRWHRTHHGSSTGSNSITFKRKSRNNQISENLSDKSSDIILLTPTDIHSCKDCGSAFSHLKSLREHSCKNSDNQILCSVCGHIASSKSSLKLHMFTHENTKRLKCSSCTYSTNDHNSFRRHKMTHENTKIYNCPYCSYESIQSITFQKHVLVKHPESASKLIHKCKLCAYCTVNRTLFALHQIKHKPVSNTDHSSIRTEDGTISEEIILLNSIDAINKNNANNNIELAKPTEQLEPQESIKENNLNSIGNVNNIERSSN